MNGIKKSILTVALTMIVGTLFAGSALAAYEMPAYWPTDITNLTDFMKNVPTTKYTGSLSGSYYVTPLAFEAGDTIRLQTSDSNILFTNKNLASEFGTVKQTTFATTAGGLSSGAYFKDMTTNPNTTFFADDSRVKILELVNSWTVKDGLTLAAGTLILGLNDKGSGDCDYDDFILAVSKTAPTPVPAAVWLLGSGLLGVMGFKKRARKTENAVSQGAEV